MTTSRSKFKIGDTFLISHDSLFGQQDRLCIVVEKTKAKHLVLDNHLSLNHNGEPLNFKGKATYQTNQQQENQGHE